MKSTNHITTTHVENDSNNVPLYCLGGEILICLRSEILFIFFEKFMSIKCLTYMKETHEMNMVYQSDFSQESRLTMNL